MNERLTAWIKDNHLNIISVSEDLLQVPDTDMYLFVLSEKEKIFNKDMFFELEPEERINLEQYAKTYTNVNILFDFGMSFYYSPLKLKKDEYNEEQYEAIFNDFLYVGKAKDVQVPYPSLGLHTEYELLNVATNYANLIKKAKFLDCSTLAICDKNTLAGALGFQLKCFSQGIKSIIGETITVAYDYDKEKSNQILHNVKLYVKDATGWDNLLSINKRLNVDYEGLFIPESELLERGEGLICVFDYSNSVLLDNTNLKDYKRIIDTYRSRFDEIYYQFSTVEYIDDVYDLKCLKGFKFYLENFSKKMSYVLIDDVHYLEQRNANCKDILNKIGGFVQQPSEHQYFKTFDDIVEKLQPMFENSDLSEFLSVGIENAVKIGEECNFKLRLDENKLPKFEIDGVELEEEESNFYLWQLCEEGFDERIKSVIEDEELLKTYRERIETEYRVISNAGFSAYFLILWDIINHAREEDKFIGPGRGSVGGSLLAYLLRITDLDPIKYDLMFERFLNESRVAPLIFIDVETTDGEKIRFKELEKVEISEGVEIAANTLKKGDVFKDKTIKTLTVAKEKRMDSLPDVDFDTESNYRDELKRYVSLKYGEEYVCSLGTYGRLKLRQSFKDLARLKGIDFKTVNELTKQMDDQLQYTWSDLFKFAGKSKLLYDFIQTHYDLINNLKIILDNPKSVSMHPSAIAILPKFDTSNTPKKLESWMPIRRVGDVIVSEWEGKYTDAFGVLKEDVLGISQLDKFHNTLNLIEKNRGIKIDMTEIPLNDKKAYRLFQKGYNEDVFQFGSHGLKSYSLEVQPDSIDDIIAMNALYRPGPMESGFHKDYAAIKHNRRKAEYFYGMREVTQSTQGLFVYQEQIMKAVMVGGLTAVESDQVRTAMKKFDRKALAAFGDKFVRGMIEKDCPEDEAKNIWEKLLAFSGYGFNRSHSAAYGLIAYNCQWLKANYPLEFWTTAFNFGKEDVDIPYYLKEIKDNKTKVIISTPDVNKSAISFTCDPDENSIFWSLTKIKGVGDVAALKILECRGDGYNSLEDFLKRVPKNKVNKRVVKAMILSGCFDSLERIKRTRQRKEILLKYYRIMGHDPDECENCTSKLSNRDYYWVMQQKSLIGNGVMNFEETIMNSNLGDDIKKQYVSFSDFYSKKVTSGKFYNLSNNWMCGFMRNIKSFKYKDGEFCRFELENNSSMVNCVMWNNSFSLVKNEIFKWENELMLVSGRIGIDDYRNQNTLYLNDQSTFINLNESMAFIDA